MKPQYACYHELVKGGIPSTDALTMAEQCLLVSYVYGKKKIVEIGTRFARTTINLAKFCADDGRVYTIDIDQEQHKVYDGDIAPYAHKITFIQANTMKFAWEEHTELFGADVILIDGGHRYEEVKSDTLAALKLIKPDGFIFWHDFVDSNQHDPDEPLMGKPGQVCLVIRDLNLPVLPVGSYLGMLEMEKIKRVS